MIVTTAAGKANSVKIFQDLNSQLATHIETIAEICRTGRASRLIQLADQVREGANKRGNSSRLTQSFHFFMFEPIFSPVNALNQPI